MNLKLDRNLVFFDTKKRKDEYEDEDIVDTKAPLHEVGAQVFESNGFTIFKEKEYKKSHSQRNPESGLPKSFSYRYSGGFLAQ